MLGRRATATPSGRSGGVTRCHGSRAASTSTPSPAAAYAAAARRASSRTVRAGDHSASRTTPSRSSTLSMSPATTPSRRGRSRLATSLAHHRWSRRRARVLRSHRCTVSVTVGAPGVRGCRWSPRSVQAVASAHFVSSPGCAAHSRPRSTAWRTWARHNRIPPSPLS
ncbi:hypothetical protein [Ornithinimicrobium kibberense]|uniref:hypothetical protein n=1 Tax=Ornithinimicrobium kibberense TaxID=282060 RepID=UPI003608173A